MHRLWRSGSTQMQQARMLPGRGSQSVAYGAGLPRGIANLGLARLRFSSSMNTTRKISGEHLYCTAQQQLRFSATTSEDSASTSSWNGGPTSKQQGSTAAAGAAPKRSGWICPYASNYQPRSADFNLHDFVPLTGIPYVPPQPALTSTSTSGSSAASTVGAKGGDEGSAAVVAQQQTVGSSGKVESSTSKKQYLTTTFRRYRYVDQGSAVVSDGQHLVKSLTPLDLGNDVDFACLYLNACVMFDAPPPPPSMLNHLREVILPRIQTAAQVEAVLSALWLLCGPGSRSFDRRKSATRQRLAGGFPSRRSEDSVPPKSAAPSSGQSAQVSQEAPSDSSLTTNSASTGWEAFLRAVAPQLDALVPTMSKNTLVLTACVYGQSAAATPLLMQGLLERGVMLKESFTPHDTAQFLFSLVTCPCFGDSPEIPELFSEFSAQIVDKINQTAAEDAARLLYAFALAKMASAEVIDVLGRRLYFVVHAVSPDAVGMTFAAMVLMGLDAPLLRKSLCEAIRYMDPTDFSPLSALDIAWGLTQFPTSNSLGASRIGAEADILDLIMSRILQDKATILATEDSRNKLLAVSIALGSSSPGQSGGPATPPSLQ